MFVTRKRFDRVVAERDEAREIAEFQAGVIAELERVLEGRPARGARGRFVTRKVA